MSIVTPQFALASKSPRRKELLLQMGFRFEIVEDEVEEIPQPGETPQQYALRIARAKALAAGARAHPVLGADTDVVLDGRILGKPRDEADAVSMLCALSNRAHQVVSGVALAHGNKVETALSVTEVVFSPLSEAAARRYWASGEPAGKAGAYAIQGVGAQFVREIRGSYSGVVGLPLFETCDLLARFGVQVPA